MIDSMIDEEEVKRAIREFLVENWEGFRAKAKDQGLDEDFVDSENFDELIDEILLDVK